MSWINKTIILLLACYSFTATRAARISELKLMQNQYTTQDSVVVFYKVVFPHSPVIKDSLKWNLDMDTINIISYCRGGNLTVPAAMRDTLQLGTYPKGTYRIKFVLIDTEFGDKDTSSLSFTVEEPNAIGKPIAPAGVALFPNPCTSFLSIQSREPVQRLVLLDISGRLLEEILFRGKRTGTLNLCPYKPGSYLLKVADGNGAVQVFKVQKR